MAVKNYTEKELQKKLQDDGFDIADENNSIDPYIVADIAKDRGFQYNEDLDVWQKHKQKEKTFINFKNTSKCNLMRKSST